jgi:hypothetical protein
MERRRLSHDYRLGVPSERTRFLTQGKSWIAFIVHLRTADLSTILYKNEDE